VRAIFLFPFFVGFFCSGREQKEVGLDESQGNFPTQLLIPPQNQEREKKRNIFEFEPKVKNTKSKGGNKSG
jgi:hypothetical protein